MNERIRELADEAIEDMPGAWNIPDEFCDKFAELIIRECLNRVGNKICPNYAYLAISEHFGVEE
jgi:hypothetical protein